MNIFYDILVVGSGPAGSTAAIYASRDGFKTGVIEGNMPGGLLTTTTVIENFPGFVNGIDGFELVMNMKNQAIRYGAEYIQGKVAKIEKNDNFVVYTEDNTIIEAKSVIIASGSSPRKLGYESEARFWGKGVHTCATCDGAFYRNKEVVVIGGGDSAMEESHFLAKFATKVTILNRSEEPKATKVMQDKALSDSKVSLINSTEVIEFFGNDKLERIRIKNSITGANEEMLVDGVFLAIGHIPNTGYLEGFAELEPSGNIKVSHNVYTSVDGLFAAGDVVDHIYKQAISSAGMGCMAAIAARKYLQK